MACFLYLEVGTSIRTKRLATQQSLSSRIVMVECKNYSKDPANPKVDQLAGRFGVNRGQLGMLLYHTVDDHGRLFDRCRDTAQDGRGYMIALGDEQVIELLELIADGQRMTIDARLQAIFNRLVN